MSYFCQFCDLEMKFDASVKYVKDYITCGKFSCVAKANSNDKYYAEQAPHKINVNVVVFKTKTPEMYDTWLAIKPEEHPVFLKNPDIMKALLDGDIANLKDSEDCYRVRTLVDCEKSEFSFAVQLLLDDLNIQEQVNNLVNIR